jgi:heme/copper-type cytochrome/quinol oxidase subunit 2
MILPRRKWFGMPERTWLSLGIAVAVLALITFIGWSSTRRPNRDKKLKEAIRQPKIVAIIGWVVLLLGLLFVLVPSSSEVESGDALPMQICGFVLFLVGSFLVFIYANWYLIIREDEVELRTAFRYVRTIRYHDVERYLYLRRGIQPSLKVWSIHGVVIELNPRTFDVTPIVAALEARNAAGT